MVNDIIFKINLSYFILQIIKPCYMLGARQPGPACKSVKREGELNRFQFNAASAIIEDIQGPLG